VSEQILNGTSAQVVWA